MKRASQPKSEGASVRKGPPPAKLTDARKVFGVCVRLEQITKENLVAIEVEYAREHDAKERAYVEARRKCEAARIALIACEVEEALR